MNKKKGSRKLPKVLTQPIVVDPNCDPKSDKELINQIGQRIAAVCTYFEVDVASIHLGGSAMHLVLEMAEHCFPKAFQCTTKVEMTSSNSRRHHWTAPRKFALMALIDEYRDKGYSIRRAADAVYNRYSAKGVSRSYRLTDPKSLSARYHEFKRWEKKLRSGVTSDMGESGLPVNPDGTPNWRAAGDKFALYENWFVSNP